MIVVLFTVPALFRLLMDFRTLDPRVEMDKDLTPHGTGNQCSVEFNL